MPLYSTSHSNVPLNLSTLSRARGSRDEPLMKLHYLHSAKLAPMSRARPGQSGQARSIQKMLIQGHTVHHKDVLHVPTITQGQYVSPTDRGRQASLLDREMHVQNQGPSRSTPGHVTTVTEHQDASATSPPRPLTRKLVRDAAVTPPSPRILNTLQRCLPKWKSVRPSAWVLCTIAREYSLQFAKAPRLTRNFIPTNATGEALVTLRAEIQTLLAKGAIRKANLSKRPAGFYSHYFLIPKKGGAAYDPY